MLVLEYIRQITAASDDNQTRGKEALRRWQQAAGGFDVGLLTRCLVDIRRVDIVKKLEKYIDKHCNIDNNSSSGSTGGFYSTMPRL